MVLEKGSRLLSRLVPRGHRDNRFGQQHRELCRNEEARAIGLNGGKPHGFGSVTRHAKEQVVRVPSVTPRWFAHKSDSTDARARRSCPHLDRQFVASLVGIRQQLAPQVFGQRFKVRQASFGRLFPTGHLLAGG
jgi:hypothetical protein